MRGLASPEGGQIKSKIPLSTRQPIDSNQVKRTPPGRGPGALDGSELVPHIGFEPMISALRGRCPGPLDECGIDGRLGAGRAG